MSFLPPDSPEVSTLLAILADPAKSKARLEDLAKRTRELGAVTAELKARQEADAETKKELQSAHEEQINLRAENEDRLAKLIAQNKAKSETLKQTETDLRVLKENFEAAAAKRQEALDKQEKRLADLDKTLTALDAHLRESQARSVDIRKDLDARLAKVKQLLS